MTGRNRFYLNSKRVAKIFFRPPYVKKFGLFFSVMHPLGSVVTPTTRR